MTDLGNVLIIDPAQKECLSDPMPHLIVTPLNCICKICSEDTTTNKHAIIKIGRGPVRAHFKKFHNDKFVLIPFQNLSINLDVAKLRATKGGWREQLPKDKSPTVQKHTICTGCNATFGRDSNNFKRHIIKGGNACREAMKSRGDCIQLICGGWFPIPSAASILPLPSTSLDRSRRMPKSTCTTLQQYDKLLEPFVTESSIVGSWSKVLISSISIHGDKFGKYILSSLHAILEAQKSPNPVLALLNQCADKYANHFSSIAAIIPGNILSTVQNFNSVSIDDAQNYRSVFSARHSYAQIKSYLHHLFAFLLIRQCPLLQPYIDDINDETTTFSIDGSFQYAFIPSLLYDLAREVPAQFGAKTWLLEHAQLYCFRLSGGQPILDGAGWGATKLSSALHAVRAGVCGMMTTQQFNTGTGFEPAQKYAVEVRDCAFVNIISRWMRWLRDQDRNQMSARSIYYDPMENIIIDGIVFKKEIYTNLVPILYKLFLEQFELFFCGDEWKDALDLKRGVIMKNWYQFDFDIEGCNMSLVELKDETDPSGDIEKLCSILELTLYGLGLGSGRLEQVIHISTTAFKWAHNCFYYGLGSLKRGSIKAKSGDLEEHKLPFCLDRCLLLTRLIFTKLTCLDFGSKKLFPTLPSRKYSMMHLVRSIFGLKDDVGETIQVRHLFHSILNILYPDGVSLYGITITMPGLCGMCHHSPETGRLKYSGKPVYWKEQFFLDYHHNLGDRTSVIDTKIIPQAPCLDSDALDILKMVFGSDANFRSGKQKDAMLSVLNKRNNHRAILLGCGAGKTILALASTLEAHMRGTMKSMTILVAPHINLVGHQIGQIKSLLHNVHKSSDEVNNISVEHFTTLGNILPPSLDGEHLPHIAVMSIMAFSSLVKFHHNKMQWWYDHGFLGHLFLDEIQLMTSEGTIRKEYECLSTIASVGAPVTLLSGSLSKGILGVLADYLGLRSSTTPIDVISGNDLVGTHFNFEVRSKPRFAVFCVVEYAKQRMTTCHVHILCATTTAAREIHSAMSDCPKVACIIGSDDANKKMETAEQWRNGCITVLISSTCALVGNENSKCRHIMIVDRIYDLSNLIQAMGRLRVEQGGEDSFVTQFLSEEEMLDDVDTAKASMSKINELQNMGLQIDSVIDEVKMQLTEQGYSSFFRKEGCLLKNLSHIFGGDRHDDCKKCTNCDSFYNTTNATIRRVPLFLQPNKKTDQDNGDECNESSEEYDSSKSNFDPVEAESNGDKNLSGEADVSTLIETLNSTQTKKSNKITSSFDDVAATRRRPQSTKLAKMRARVESEQKEACQEQRRKSKVQRTHYQNKAFRLGGNPGMQSLIESARRKEQQTQSVHDLATTQLRHARICCPQCNGRKCNGIDCFIRRECFRCYGPHNGSACPFKVEKKQYRDENGEEKWKWIGNTQMTKFMQEKSRGCVICFDPECQETTFDINKPHQAKKRIRGALFKARREGENFLHTLQRCYATCESRDNFFACMSKSAK